MFLVGFAIAHVLLTVVSMLAALGTVMAGFDGGAEASPRSIVVLVAANDVLLWPMIHVRSGTRSAVTQYALLFVNGLRRGTAVLSASLLVRRIRSRRSHHAGLTA